MEILILVFVFKMKACKIIRGHDFSLKDWNKLSSDCLHSTSVNNVQEQNTQVSC